ncbi:hypothetical protein P154DRAFT_213473 [Amniculicola lignicola CBS 123094]|uniref:Calcofluor white hypersensitive protein n=1 Tax=Amniculicola lignicola CBS 123094 TaxID=1392246 RepID=A0A6A5WDP9_9PLEO|nr:hypothetical protein P154DRAFT_213473 [Amniculicola lignicola CBS 123094]
MAGRIVKFGGVAAAAGAAYYLYAAGGDPKLAEKKLEHDIATATRRAKGEVVGREGEAKKAGAEAYESLRASAEELSAEAKAAGRKADATFDAYHQDATKKLEEARAAAAKEVNAASDKFDQKVHEGVKETKSWFGGFFGGK